MRAVRAQQPPSFFQQREGEGRARQIKAGGIDTASIDHGQSTQFESHVALLSQNVPVLENLAELRSLPEKNFDVIALPMKIAGGTGGPLRIIAVLPR
ncbi:MAG: hypothetical protein FJ247_00075 [Nitrospira sp.]|nr:hypothetical protein [Nitrospira sp.]